MATKHPLRRSCAFCRQRKIKCSNETICEACRKQGADCIYDFEPPRPKSRTISQDSTRPDSRLGQSCPSSPHRQRSSTASSTHGSPGASGMDHQDLTSAGGVPIEEGDNVARALELQFYENFSTDTQPRSNPWQERIAAYHRSVQNSIRERPSGMSTKFLVGGGGGSNGATPRNIKYSGILSLLTHDLVGLVTDQFGALGCHHVEEGGARLFLQGLVTDDTQTMFDGHPLGGNPLQDYGQRQQTQLIDVWFSVHPLSFLVSKTLLLREIRDGTHDEILLATMLADANFSIGDEVAVARGHVLLRWAVAQLRLRPMRSGNGSSLGSSGVSTRIFGQISTAQALMLLGWNSLCSFQIRRATCYIGLAGKVATEIKEQIATTAAPMTSSRINGIDVFDVEKELVAYLYWTTYSLSLWAFVQMGNGHFPALLPTALTSIFLPVTEASSVIIQLDLVSENFSTLQKQKSVIREMWPLAHIASVIAYIYALYPQDMDRFEPPGTSFWQEAPLLALQRLQQGKPTQDISSVCREINRVLMESIHILNRQVTEVSSRSLVLTVYHTMAVHFLFPQPSSNLQGQSPEEGITPEVIDRFCSSSQEILHIFSLVSEQPPDMFAGSPTLRGSFPDVFCMALDTCARALSHVHEASRQGRLAVDASMAPIYDSSLEALATRLYAMSQSDFLNQGTSLRLVRKHLKANLRAFGSRTSSVSSSRSLSMSQSPSLRNSPDLTRSLAASMPQSPAAAPQLMRRTDSGHLSTATTAVLDQTPQLISHRSSSNVTSSSSSSSLPPHANTPGSTLFSPPLQDPSDKLGWDHGDSLFSDVLDPNALGIAPGPPPSSSHSHHNDDASMTAADMVDMNAAAAGWYGHGGAGAGGMDFDAGGMQWEFSPTMGNAEMPSSVVGPDAAADSMMYFFDQHHHHQQQQHQHQQANKRRHMEGT